MEDKYWFPLCEVLSICSTKKLLEQRANPKGWRFITCDKDFVLSQSKKLEPLHGFFYQSRALDKDPAQVSYLTITGIETYNNLLDFLRHNSEFELWTHWMSKQQPQCLSLRLQSHEQRMDKNYWPNPCHNGFISLSFCPFRKAVVLNDFKIVMVKRESNHNLSFIIYCSVTMQWKRSDESVFLAITWQERAVYALMESYITSPRQMKW